MFAPEMDVGGVMVEGGGGVRIVRERWMGTGVRGRVTLLGMLWLIAYSSTDAVLHEGDGQSYSSTLSWTKVVDKYKGVRMAPVFSSGATAACTSDVSCFNSPGTHEPALGAEGTMPFEEGTMPFEEGMT